MYNRSKPALFATYFGVLAMALGVLCLGFMTALQASSELARPWTAEKTSLQMQVESSREIKQALATPISIAPLPPITARVAHKTPAIVASNQSWKLRSLSPEALNAMAMDERSVAQSLAATEPSRVSYSYSVADRTAPQ